MPPGRNAVRPALALEHDEGGVVLRALFRVQAETVRKINETAQRVERALSDKLVDVLENRAEIGRRLADKLEMRHVVGKFLRVVNDLVRAQLVVALQDAQVDAAEKARVLLEQLAGHFEKGADELARGGHGGVDGDDETSILRVSRVSNGSISGILP